MVFSRDNMDVKFTKTRIILKALANESIEAKCMRCGATEFIIEINEPIDEIFLANYHCEKCDQES
jgi:uncharacterized cysteine cluster protein YcgN (CxxCxxCC family)